MRVGGVGGLPPETLRRIWSCCPPDKITHLEAKGGPQFVALGKYMLEQPGLSGLRTLRMECPHETWAEDYDVWDGLGWGLSKIWKALGQGHAPGLQEVVIEPGQCSNYISPLAEAICKGKLPELSSIYLWGECPRDVDEFLDQLHGTTHSKIRPLDLGVDFECGGNIEEVFCRSLADALKAGGELGQLETLRLRYRCEDAHAAAVLDALVSGGPCSQTLRTLEPFNSFWKTTPIPRLIAGLGGGIFPRLITIRMASCRFEEDMMHAFTHVLLRLVDKGTPFPLEELEISRKGLLAGLTVAFRAGALPHLKRLVIPHLIEGEDEFAFLEEWKGLGGNVVRLEELKVCITASCVPQLRPKGPGSPA